MSYTHIVGIFLSPHNIMNLAKVQNLKLVMDSTYLHVGPPHGAAMENGGEDTGQLL